MLAAKVILTGLAGGLYIAAVTQPTPLSARLCLLAGIALFGWLFYVRLPSIPTQIIVTDDGWLNFQSRRGNTRVLAADIRSIGLTPMRRALRVKHAGGEVTVPNRFTKLVDFLLSVKGLNPSVEMVGF
jgi:hypothetical protein